MANTKTRKKRARAIVASLPRRNCLWCGKEFRLEYVVLGGDTHNFCSEQCAYASMTAREAGDWEKAQERAVLNRVVDADTRMANARNAKGKQRGEVQEVQEQEVQQVHKEVCPVHPEGKRGRGRPSRRCVCSTRRIVEAEDKEGRPHVQRPNRRRRSSRLV